MMIIKRKGKGLVKKRGEEGGTTPSLFTFHNFFFGNTKKQIRFMFP